jgi:hypothetical protein
MTTDNPVEPENLIAAAIDAAESICDPLTSAMGTPTKKLAMTAKFTRKPLASCPACQRGRGFFTADGPMQF